METIQDYRHIETREGLFGSKELPTYIPLMSHVQTLRKNDTEQDSTCHRTTPHQGTGRFQIREIMRKSPHHTSPICPLCKTHPHTTDHLFNCTHHRPPIQLHTPIYLKQHTGPLEVSRESGASAGQVEETHGRAALKKLRCRTPPQLHAGGVGRQQQQEGMITGTAFVDLSAAYDMVNHRLLIQKLSNTTLNSQLCRVIQNLLSDRRFYVVRNNERSRWRIQKNGLPQGSVLSTTLLNIYTNDQPIIDHLCIIAQYPTFQEVEHKIEEALGELTHYYRSNSLRANSDKTQVTAFHLRNREAKGSLQVSWNGVDLENTDTPKYLAVTLDRTLSYKKHIHNTKMKVATRNNLPNKLANSRW